MARKLKEFPDDMPLPRISGKYPWNDWLNGEPWELTQGVDFPGKMMGFRQNATKQAKRRGGNLKAATYEDEKRLVIQFVKTQ